MITFNINYNNNPKKVSINRNKTIQDLVNLSCSKYALNYGELYYQSKKLNPLDSIRFTPLINNCKLVLKPIELREKIITSKIFKPNGESIINKISNKLPITEIVSDLSLPQGNYTLNLLNKSINIEENKHLTLSSIVGDVDNLVIRINEVKQESRQQREIVEQQLKLQALKNKELSAKKELEDEQRQQRINQSRQSKPPLEPDTVQEALSKTPINEARNNELKSAPQPNVSDASTVSEAPKVSEPPKASEPKPAIDDQQRGNIDGDAMEVDIPRQDTIYKPSQVQIYENPDEDYEFTVNHAKLYQESIKYKRKPSTNKPLKVPENYQIRIKFPNNYLLQITLAKNSKFGELIKKIDNYLTEDFKSNFSLKLSYPPFTKFPIGFLNNNKLLTDLKFDEKIILIWESEVKGQYLIDSEAQDFSALPEVKLESMRSNLPDANDPPKSHSTPSNNPDKSSSGKKTPKWLKLGK